MKQSRSRGERPSPPPPLEANDQLVTGAGTVAWAIALVVLLIVRDSLPAGARWWIWTCVSGLVLGLFGLWYVPRLKRARAKAALRAGEDQSEPRDSGSNSVSSTDTPGKSTRS